jgi:hypothetical protein
VLLCVARVRFAFALAGTPAVGTSATHLSDHDLGKVEQAFIPPFSVLELLKFLPLLPNMKRDLSLSDLWTLWSFFGCSIDYIQELFTTNNLLPLMTLIDVQDARLDPMLTKAKSEFLHISQHAPHAAIQRLTMLPFEHQSNILKDRGYSFLREKGLVELLPKMENVQKRQAVLQPGFLKNVVHMSKYVKPFTGGVLPTLQGLGLESMLADLIPDLSTRNIWPFPFQPQDGAFSVSEIKLFAEERDVDGIFQISYPGEDFIDLVIYDLKRSSRSFNQTEQKMQSGRNAKATIVDEGPHFKMFFKYNVKPHLPVCEMLCELKVRHVHIVAFPGFLIPPDTTSTILQAMLTALQDVPSAKSWRVHVQTLESLNERCGSVELDMTKYAVTKGGWPLIARECYRTGAKQFERAQRLERPLLVPGLRRIGKSQFLQYLRHTIGGQSIYMDLKATI